MITVYSKSICPACVSTKAMLAQYDINFNDVDIEVDSEAKKFILSEGHRQVPQIYGNNNVFIKGGWLGLKAMQKEEIIKILYGENADILDTTSK